MLVYFFSVLLFLCLLEENKFLSTIVVSLRVAKLTKSQSHYQKYIGWQPIEMCSFPVSEAVMLLDANTTHRN